MPFQLSKKTMTIPTLFYLFIYLSKSHYGNKNSETTKTRNLKFGQMIGLYMDLRHCNFGGATSRGLGHMHPKLVTAKFMKWFYSRTRACCHGRMVKVASAWNLRPGFNTLLGHRFYQTNIILNLAHYFFFFHFDEIVYTFLFDARYDQRVSGFILCEDVLQINF